jgi:hypothetical protein
VVLSLGSQSDLERAVELMAKSIRWYGAQLVVARAEDGTASADLLRDHPNASIVRAPKGSSRAQLCDAAMAAATGDIVALRDDSAVRDGNWLDSFSGPIQVSQSPPADVVVADYTDFTSHLQTTERKNRAPTEQDWRALSAATVPPKDSSESGSPRLAIPLADLRPDHKRAVAREF